MIKPIDYTIRPARIDEAGLLSALALRSKGHWGYDQEFLDCYIDELTVSAAYIKENHCFVVEADEDIIGFLTFIENDDGPYLDFLFVDTVYIGQGAGLALWNHGVRYAENQGWSAFKIVSDPNATPYFYLKRGCVKIGEVDSTAIPGRQLPLLQYEL